MSPSLKYVGVVKPSPTARNATALNDLGHDEQQQTYQHVKQTTMPITTNLNRAVSIECCKTKTKPITY